MIYDASAKSDTSFQLSSDHRAYVMLDLEPDVVHDVITELRRYASVILADAVNSDHEAIAVVEGDTSQLAGTLFIKIKKMAGVRSMRVLMAHETPPAYPEWEEEAVAQ